MFILIVMLVGGMSAWGLHKIDTSPDGQPFTWPTVIHTEKVTMDRYKLVCRNAKMEEVFTVEGWATEAEAQTMLDTLNAGRLESDCTWRIEPLRYN